MLLSQFLEMLSANPQTIEFEQTMSVIDDNYDFVATAFTNGLQNNAAGENSGSCKIFYFAQLNKLNEAQTLACFGLYYREHVLQHPQANDHQNIRQFMINGWKGINFSSQALIQK